MRIETERLLLREMRSEDVDDLLCIFSDPLVMASFGGKGETELGYDFRSDHWKQGFATEAAAAVRDFGFHSLRLPRIISLIRPGNRSSQRVAEKIRMTLAEEISRSGQAYWVYAVSPPEAGDACAAR